MSFASGQGINYRIMTNRRQSREFVFRLLFESSFHTDEELTEMYQTALEESETAENEYIRTVFSGVIENRIRIDEIIKKKAIGWKMDRISRITLAVLRLAIYEILYMPDIPFNISINEALELTKRYDEESARTFVNGVLDAVAKNEQAAPKTKL